MRRFRLLSFIVAVCFAGILLGANLRGEYEYIPAGFMNSEIGNYSYGFPSKAVHFSATIFYDGSESSLNPLIAMNNLKKEELQRVEQGWMHVHGSPLYIDKIALAINLLVLLAGGIAALSACEFFLRRRESRVHAA